MLGTKLADRVAVAAIAAALAISLLLCVFSGTVFAGADGGITMQYESRLFNHSSIMSVNIIMDDDDWQDMLDNAASEEYYKCNVEINGTTFYSVGIRPKGNTSLSSIVNDPTTDRYSFKLEFDHYVDGQTCFGLDKLILNNNYADATNMKEAIVYDMFAYLGADSSLYNYAEISVNDEYWGIYLALEGVEDSFLMRNYGTGSGNLYKPDSMEMGGGKNDDDRKMPDNIGQAPGGETDSQSENGGFPGGFTPPDMNGTSESGAPDFSEMTPPGGKDDFSGGMPFGSSGGSDLNYTDDDLDSYSDIWDGEVNSTGKSDHKRVVAALKAAAEGSDLEDYLDIDNLLKYMAVHEFVVNLDSLSGNMAHNYYLYESGGIINLIPWDYNLAFGGMNGTSSTAVNDAIDTPFSGTQFFDAVLENEEYLARYHEYLRILCEEYVGGGVLRQTYDRIRSQIDSIVNTDPNAFYTYDEYDTAAQMLLQVIELRAESVSGQLDGTIPSTDDGQNSDPSALTDTSGIDISVMGGMGGGNRMDNAGNGGFGDRGNAGGGEFGGVPGDAESVPADGEQQSAQPPQRSDSASADDSQKTDSASADETNASQSENTSADSSSESGAAGGADAQFPGQNGNRPGGRGNGGFPGAADDSEGGSSDMSGLIPVGISAAVIAAGLVFAFLFRRR